MFSPPSREAEKPSKRGVARKHLLLSEWVDQKDLEPPAPFVGIGGSSFFLSGLFAPLFWTSLTKGRVLDFGAAPESFPPELRLHYSWEYRKFFKGSEVVHTSACTLFRVRNELGHPRLGITVKARVNSVQRNRVKRAIREAFRRARPILGSYDYNAVVPGSRVVSHEFLIALKTALKEELPRALARAVPARNL